MLCTVTVYGVAAVPMHAVRNTMNGRTCLHLGWSASSQEAAAAPITCMNSHGRTSCCDDAKQQQLGLSLTQMEDKSISNLARVPQAVLEATVTVVGVERKMGN